MSNDNRYDIIIIGTGAGGGTLAHHLAPSGQRILILERGDYVPREKANWDPKVVNVDAHYNTKETWLDKNGKELHPHTNYYVGAIPSSTAPRCFGCVNVILARCITTAEFRPLGRLATVTWSRTTPKPSSSTASTATAVKIRRSHLLPRITRGRR